LSKEILLGGIATLITMMISIINYYQTNDKFFKDLFKEFNSRYDAMNEYLNSLADNRPITEPKEKQKIIDYFILCAEEYMWVKKGRIPIDIWLNWKFGIKEHLQKEGVKKIYDEEIANGNSYYGFFEEMRKK
jgi:hypothetical protein